MRIAYAALALTACMTAARPAEVVQLGPTPPPGAWTALRDALTSCAVDGGLAGQEMHVRIGIDEDGGAGSVTSNQGGEAFTACVGRALAGARFPRERRGHTIEVPFVVATQ
jgi:hypothetical protein